MSGLTEDEYRAWVARAYAAAKEETTMTIIEAHYPHQRPGVWSYVAEYDEQTWQDLLAERDPRTEYRITTVAAR